MTETDAALVERARALDKAAFAELYDRYFERVYDFLARMVRDREEAADLAQETFLRAMNSLGSLQKGASFKSWIFTIARNQALNRLERAGRTQPLGGRGEDDDDVPAFDLPDPSALADPAAAAEANELAAIVWEAASALDAKQYSLLDLHVRQGLESAEIAEVLGVTRNNAYVMVNRLKQALSEAVGALVLFRSGRGRCAELDAIVARLAAASLSPEARRAIDRHAGACPACAERRRTTLPLAAFGGLALVRAPDGAKAQVLGAVLQAWPPTGAAGSGTPASTADGAAPPPQAWPPGATQPNAVGPGRPDGVGGGPWRRVRRGALLAGGAAAVLVVTLLAVVALPGGGSDDTAAEAGTVPPASPPASAAAGGPTTTPTATSPSTPAATATTSPPTPTPPATSAAAGMTTATGETITGGGVATPTAPATPPATPTPVLSPSTTPSPPPVTETATPPAVTETPPPVTTTPPLVTVTPRPPVVTVTPGPSLCRRSFTVTPASLGLTGAGGQATVVVRDTSTGCTTGTAITATPGASWMVITPTTASLPPAGAVTVVVRVNGANPPRSAQSSQVTIAGGGTTATVAVAYRPSSTPGGPGGFTTGD